MSENLQYLAVADRVPQGGFSFVVPENGYRMGPFHTIQELYDKVQSHYQDNNLALPDNWKELVVDQLCQRLPAGWCMYKDGEPSKGITNILSFDNIKKGVASLTQLTLDAVKGEDPFVGQDEANRRAEICARCHLNMNASFCMGCGGARIILDMVAKVKGERKTPLDNMLQNCGVCGCRNDAIVHVKKNILLKGESEDTTNKRPKWCWLVNDSIEDAKQKLHI